MFACVSLQWQWCETEASSAADSLAEGLAVQGDGGTAGGVCAEAPLGRELSQPHS